MDGAPVVLSTADSGGLLMEDYDIEKANKTKKHKISPNMMESNIDAQVAKSIKDNFKGFGPAEIDGTAISGITLRDQIRMDKLANSVVPGSITMGRKSDFKR